MTTIRLHNSQTRRKEEFEPIDPKNVRVYLCGPTVYDRAHLGNARNVILFDVLVAVLREVYGPSHVTYARNFTDVDDKINARAAETGRSIAEITHETIAWYHADMDALGVARPDHEPRATEWIAPMVAMIEALIAKGHAYAAEGHVLFSVESDPDYGSLSGRSVDDMIAGARVEVAPYKRNPMDFVMWKPSSDDLPGWDSPWGRGRPGWHIECSAMTEALFGPSFDIHGGGTDLLFPHHENELAQSRCAHPDGAFANYWLHNEMLLVEGKKMSKSLGNFFTIRDLLDQGVPGEVIRFVFLMTQYGKPMDWTEKKRDEAQGKLDSWRAVLVAHGFTADLVAGLKASGEWVQDNEFLGVLANDMNTPGALARLHVLAKGKTAAKLVPFAAGLELLGLVLDWSGLDLDVGPSGLEVQDREKIDALLVARGKARTNKDWSEADRIRDVLSAAGVVVRDVGGQVTWETSHQFDGSKLEDMR